MGDRSGRPDGRSAQARLLAGEDAPVPFDEVLRLVREDLTPHFPPQSVTATKRRASYADTNYQLLGAVVAHVTGEALHEEFARMVLRPARAGQHLLVPPPASLGSVSRA